MQKSYELPSSNTSWYHLLAEIYGAGMPASPRKMLTHEILGKHTVFNMQQPIVLNKARKIGYRFMAAEAAWILSGDNRLSTIGLYSKAISRFSDDGVFFKGAYGPKVIDQLSYVVDSLFNDDMSRQAVMSIWRENPRNSFDTPCTISVQWILREGTIHTFLNMRSSDVWLGVPYDVFNFTMLTVMVCHLLKRRTGILPDLGELHLYAGSQHVYANNFSGVEEVLNSYRDNVVENVEVHPAMFQDHAHLIEYLQDFSNCGELSKDGFLARLRKEKEE